MLVGVRLTDPVLTPHGFRFELRGAGRSSGGSFAWGEYVRGDRRLELHFRRSLGLVTYHVGDMTVGHESYMRALDVGVRENRYPGFSEDPLDGFRHLADDLDRFCADFLSGDASVLREAAAGEASRTGERHLSLQAQYVGDGRKRKEARRQFHGHAYEQVVRLLEDLRYPELLTNSERRMLEIARHRAAG